MLAVFRTASTTLLNSSPQTNNHTLRKVTAAGAVTTFAGTAGMQGATDGTGGSARFNTPFGLGVDSAGVVYVADTGNHTIRKVASSQLDEACCSWISASAVGG